MANEDESQSLILQNSGADVEGGERQGRRDDEEDGVNYNWSFFHLTFMMAAFYLMMVITDWANIRCAIPSHTHAHTHTLSLSTSLSPCPLGFVWLIQTSMRGVVLCA